MISVLIVDEQNLVCQGLKTMLELEQDLQVVGIACNGEVAIKQVEALQPNLVLMDVQIPLMDGITATRIICERFPKITVLALSMLDENKYIVESIQAGAKGYLLKNMPIEHLVIAIRLVCQGYTQLAPGLLEKLMKNSLGIAKSTKKQDMKMLTCREQQVLHSIANGATNREIAEHLVITEGTVKTHVTHLLNRLNCKNRSQLAIIANSLFGN